MPIGQPNRPRGPRYAGEERVALLKVIRETYQEGFTIRQIAAIYDRSYGWARLMVVESGAELRTRAYRSNGEA